ncbi:hypothetical protein AYM17_05460 [Coxiella burnetii]|uniref:Uncharacterized protein n=2 Tax=Coxiella burnetii TaxID=777 RepID=Q83D64_COXBU|nr:hypothetical protein [Coxiella burnetii]NP_819895.1 hypothetical protein CBU_0877 [Coxiella burnetii RSA 493]AAO90409.1 hypothetical protein CBU_0877 [Coxiella burnetii RSA 493]ABS77712.1 hypothetical protein CBUD_0943 [Coxiella burnetii Dugway 5J108-111]ACJ18461.1 hypothetical protein CbuG_1124 [Coxiella burnetii CbuG_Q212]ARI65709.1 hypothetical protein B7L74_04470 [Coxiella burnetii]ARK27184.1 hypothetical protein BMW92_04340 [Coxiella burnetii]
MFSYFVGLRKAQPTLRAYFFDKVLNIVKKNKWNKISLK